MARSVLMFVFIIFSCSKEDNLKEKRVLKSIMKLMMLVIGLILFSYTTRQYLILRFKKNERKKKETIFYLQLLSITKD